MVSGLLLLQIKIILFLVLCPVPREHTRTLLSGLLWAPTSRLPCFALEDNSLCLCPVARCDCYRPSCSLPTHPYSSTVLWGNREERGAGWSTPIMYLSALLADRCEFPLRVWVYLFWGGGGRNLLLLPGFALSSLLQSAFKSYLGLLSTYFIHSPKLSR